MQKLVLLLLLGCMAAYSQPELPGGYAAGNTTVALQRNGRSLQTTIFYPAVAAGANTPPDTLRGPYPVIAFGHGFLTQVSWYTSLLRHLASHGYVVLAPQFQDTQHGELADDLLYLIDWVQQENKRRLSLFYSIIDTLHTGVTGHSMGGGAALLAASRSRGIQLAAPMAPAETSPSVIAVINNARAAVCIIAAANDGITPVATNQQPMYANALPFKMLTILKGGNHTRFMDNASLDFSDPRGYLSRTEQLRLARRDLTAACNLLLRGDTLMKAYLFGAVAAGDTQVIRSVASGAVPPGSFRQYGPAGTVTVFPARFSWQPSAPLIPGNTVTYVVRFSASASLRDSAFAYYSVADTVMSVPSLPAGVWFWQVVARTSDSTATASAAPLQIAVQQPAAVGTEMPEAIINAFPNPAAGLIYVTGIAGGEVLLYNHMGELCSRAEAVAGRAVLDAAGLPQGVYYWVVPRGIKPLRGKVVLAR